VLFPLIAMISGVPLIGWAKPVPVDQRNLHHPRRDFLFIAAAGPVSNLLLAAGLAMIYRVTLPGQDTIVFAVLATALLLNVLLAVFNMVPIPPLDGGNVLAGLLPARMAHAYDRAIRPYGFIILYGLMLTGILWRLVQPVQVFILSWLL
jgi:Zn-dependent protease